MAVFMILCHKNLYHNFLSLPHVLPVPQMHNSSLKSARLTQDISAEF